MKNYSISSGPGSTATRRVSAVVAVALFTWLGGCDSGSSSPSRIDPAPNVALRRVGTSAAAGDALAAALLSWSGRVPAHGSHPALPTPLSASLEQRAAFHSLDHLEISGMGSADGVDAVGSSRIRRLAEDDDAPEDRNGNGSNLDETLARQLVRIHRLAGSTVPAGLSSSMFPFRAADARVDVPPSVMRGDLAAWRASSVAERVIEAGDIGHAMLARVRAVQALLNRGRGPLFGANERDGRLGVVFLEQVLAAEETLLAAAFFDGDAIGPLDDPEDYDAADEPHWIPFRLRLDGSRAFDRAPGSFLPQVQSSDLESLSVLLEAAAELAWLGSEANSNAELRRVIEAFTDDNDGDGGADEDRVNWIEDIQPIINGRGLCIQCHVGAFPPRNFRVDSYERVLEAGDSGVPGVTPGDVANSALAQVIQGEWVPPDRSFPIPRMPDGGPFLEQPDIDLILEWIEDGAPRDPGSAEPPAQPGLILGRVLFRNLVALHGGDVVDGARSLFPRGGTDGEREVEARSVGRALMALSAFVAVDEEEPGARQFLVEAAYGALRELTLPGGAVRISGAADASRADLGAHAAVTAGLLAAARTLGDGALRRRGLACADALLRDFQDQESGLLFSRIETSSSELDPPTLAVAFAALREMRLAGRLDTVMDELLTALLPVIVFCELDGLGEVLGDGIPDTDGNGIAEPSAAGAAPRFAGDVRFGPELRPDDTAPVSFADEILPLFRSRCSGCHVDGADRGDYRVDTPELARQAGRSSRDDLIVPGDPAASFLFQKLTQRSPAVGEQMPFRQPPLSAAGVELVRRWILEGARDN